MNVYQVRISITHSTAPSSSYNLMIQASSIIEANEFALEFFNNEIIEACSLDDIDTLTIGTNLSKHPCPVISWHKIY